jgi:hypothetical protein
MSSLHLWPLDIRDFIKSLLVSTAAVFSLLLVSQAYASTVTLSVVVNTSITFTSSTDNFSTITPGTAAYATTTVSVATNDANGWNVTLSGDNKNNQPQNNLQFVGATSTQITDQAEWVPGSATTTAGNGVVIASLGNSGNVLAFRVMSASSTNGAPFLATSWWGASDAAGTATWAGIASSTVARQIGNAGVGSYSATTHINTVNYYLNVATTQKTGTYNAPITYTATGN